MVKIKRLVDENVRRKKRYIPSIGAALNVINIGGKGEIIDRVIGIVDIAFGVKDILQEFGILPDKQSEEFEKVLNAIGKNYEAIEEVGYKVDRNFAAIKVVFEVISKTLSIIEETRIEMRQGFKHILESIDELKVEDKISSLATYMNDFSRDVDMVNKLTPSVHVSELERSGGILDKIKSSIASDGILHGNLYHIINERLAIPKNADDNVAFVTFHVLYYGVQTYVSEMFFVLDQYSFLADFYYKKGDIEKCNNQFDLLQLSFMEFKASLLSDHNKIRLIDKIIEIIIEMEGLIFVKNKRQEVYDILQKRKESLRTVSSKLEEMSLPIFPDQPGIITHKPDFSQSKVTTPIGRWKNGANVCYAVQYKYNNTYSKIGEWSEPFRVDYKANPIIKVPVDPERRTRLIFRKFNNDKPELVVSIQDKNQITFRDINRDLFDAAMDGNEDIAKKDVEVLINNGASLNEIFDDGRQAIHAAAWRGNTKIAMEFLKNHNASDIDVRDANGYTPIYIAAEAGYEDFVQFSIARGADVNVKTNFDKYTPLHIAAYKGDVPTIEVLMQSKKIDINSRDKRGFTPLHTAMIGGTHAVNTLLLSNNTDINAKSIEGLTPLQVASINGFEDVTEVLMKSNKLDLNSVANGNLTALHFASSLGNTKVVRYLVLGNDIDLNFKSADGWTALHYATFLKKEDTALALIKLPRIEVNVKGKRNITPLHVSTVTEQKNVILELLIKGALIEEKTQDGLTALHLAAMLNKHKIISYLIESGANMEERTIEGSTSLNLAAIYGNVIIVFILLDKGANYRTRSNNGQSPIHEATLNGKDKVVLLLINHDPSQVNLQNEGSEYPLHLAALKNYVLILTLLASKMSNLNIRNNSGEGPVHYAVKNDSFDAIEFLAKRGADLNLKNNLGEAPIHWAAKNNSTNVIKCLATNGADLNIKENSGFAPIHLAAKNNFPDVIKCLADNGADLNIRDDTDLTALHWAAKENHSEAIKYLAMNGAHLDEKDRDGWTPLHWASKNGFLEATKSLVDNMADVNANDNNNDTPLHIAVQFEKMAIIIYLLKNKANINATDKVGWYGGTPLHYAAGKGLLAVVQYLIKEGANVNARDVSNTTPLHCAVVVSHDINIAKELLENKASIDPRGMDGQTPLFSAAVSCDLEMVKFLVRHGANCYTRDDNGNLPGEFIVKKLLPHINTMDDRIRYKNMVEYLRFCDKSQSFINKKEKRSYTYNVKSIKAHRLIDDHKDEISRENNQTSLKNIFGHYQHLKVESHLNIRKGPTNNISKANQNTQYPSPLNYETCLSNNVALTFFLFQRFLDKKYPLPKICSTTPGQLLASTLLITEQFENILIETAKQAGIMIKDVCFYNVYKDIGFYLKNERYTLIPKALYSFAKENYRDKDFLIILKTNIKTMLSTQQQNVP